MNCKHELRARRLDWNLQGAFLGVHDSQSFARREFGQKSAMTDREDSRCGQLED